MLAGVSLGAGGQTKTPAVQSGSPMAFDGTGHYTSGSYAITTPDDWTVTQGTHVAATMTTWGSPRQKYYAATNHINVTIGTTGTPSTGAITVLMTYLVVA